MRGSQKGLKRMMCLKGFHLDKGSMQSKISKVLGEVSKTKCHECCRCGCTRVHSGNKARKLDYAVFHLKIQSVWEGEYIY